MLIFHVIVDWIALVEQFLSLPDTFRVKYTQRSMERFVAPEFSTDRNYSVQSRLLITSNTHSYWFPLKALNSVESFLTRK